ncbi:MAG: hypothetical protein HFJ38_04420 [Bacilli bacterium]|nr:hypothetical protein [Bacilli bacterium]
MESNIIYNYQDLRKLIISHTKENAYFLIYDDLYFEKIKKRQVITREVYSIAKQILQPLSVVKYIKLNVKEDYTTKEVYEFLEQIRKETNILLTIFNPKAKEILFIYISNENSSILEQYISKIAEMESL